MHRWQQPRRLQTTARPDRRLLCLAGEPLEARAMLSASPVATNDAYDVAKNLSLAVSAANGVLANDTDPADLALTATVDAKPTHGVVTLASDGSFTYTPTAGYVGHDSFTYTDSNGANTSNVATVSLTVAAVPATVVDQNYAVFENQTLSVATPGLLTGSFDSNGPPLATQLVAQASHGVVTVNTNGSFSYQPAANYVGTDSFTYKGNDGILDSNVATVSITVGAVTQAPTTADSQWHVAENGQLVVGNSPSTSVLSETGAFNDLVYDAASGYLYGDTNTGLVAINPTTGAMSAPVPISGTPGQMVISDNGEYIYLETDYAGTIDRFNTFTQTTDLTFSMGSGVSICSLSAIPGAPDSVLISEYVGAYSMTLGTHVFKNGVSLPDQVGQDSVGEGGPNQTFVDPSGAFAYGYDSLDSSFGFAFMAIDSNGVHLIDGSGSPLYGNVGNLSEADGIVFTSGGQGVSLSTDHSIGSFAGSPNYTLDPATNKLFSVTSSGSTATIYSYALDTLQPINSFTVPVSGGVGSVTRFGDNGIAFLDSSGQVVLVSSDLVSNNPYRGVLAGASDPNGLPLTAQVVTAPQDGALTLNADGTFSYFPDPGFYGTDSFTYVASNGTLNSNVSTVTIHVDAPPIANSANFRVGENTPTAIPANLGVLASDTDPNGYTLTAELVAGPTHGTLAFHPDGSFTYTPTASFTGADSFTYKAVDAYGVSTAATVNLTVSALPVAANDTYTYVQSGTTVSASLGVLANDTPVDTDSFTAVLVTTTSNGALTLNPDGSFTYKPNAGFSGSDSFTYKANDGGLTSNLATVTLNADALAPPLAKDDSASVNELEPTTIAVLQNDDASAGATLDATSVDITSGPAHGVATVDPMTGVITYTSGAAYLGVDSFTYVVKDNFGAVSNPATVSITVLRTSTFQNPDNPYDVNSDGLVDPLDVAVEISRLHNDGAGAITGAYQSGTPYYDVIGDMQCIPLDVLLLVSDLARPASPAVTSGPADLAAPADALSTPVSNAAPASSQPAAVSTGASSQTSAALVFAPIVFAPSPPRAIDASLAQSGSLVAASAVAQSLAALPATAAQAPTSVSAAWTGGSVQRSGSAETSSVDSDHSLELDDALLDLLASPAARLVTKTSG